MLTHFINNQSHRVKCAITSTGIAQRRILTSQTRLQVIATPRLIRRILSWDYPCMSTFPTYAWRRWSWRWLNVMIWWWRVPPSLLDTIWSRREWRRGRPHIADWRWRVSHATTTTLANKYHAQCKSETETHQHKIHVCHFCLSSSSCLIASSWLFALSSAASSGSIHNAAWQYVSVLEAVALAPVASATMVSADIARVRIRFV